MVWDPAQYAKFADLRLRPALDLLGRVPVELAAHVVDLGCDGKLVAAIATQPTAADQVLGYQGCKGVDRCIAAVRHVLARSP